MKKSFYFVNSLIALILGINSASASCPSGFILTSYDEAVRNQHEACNALGTWDIARLAGKGSMDGPGYGCKIRQADSRTLGASLCKQPVHFQATPGENSCPSGLTPVTFDTANAYRTQACNALGQWDIARLSGGGSMDGRGYECKTRTSDTRTLGESLCAKYHFTKGQGE